MKKALIGMAVGAVALGATMVPVSASTPPGYETGNDTIWTGIDADFCQSDTVDTLLDGDSSISMFEQLILTGGWAKRLDTAGNGKPSYTVFAPINTIVEALLDALKLDISDLNDQPDVVKGLLADHIANGAFDPDELENSNLTRITMRSGYVATVFGENDPLNRTVGHIGGGVQGDVYVGGAKIYENNQYDNGWLYCLLGAIDSTPQVSTEGLNALDTPKDGTPGGTNSLPNTL